MPNEIGEAAPRRNGAFQGGINSDPSNSGGRNFYPPQAPPKFGGDPGFKGPSERLKPKGPSERLKPQPPKNGPKPGVTGGGGTRTLPYTGGGGTRTLPYTGGGGIKNLGGGA